jgi:hypothetical protein
MRSLIAEQPQRAPLMRQNRPGPSRPPPSLRSSAKRVVLHDAGRRCDADHHHRLALSHRAMAQESRTFRDAMGRTTGRSITNSSGATTFYDASGRVTARSTSAHRHGHGNQAQMTMRPHPELAAVAHHEAGHAVAIVLRSALPRGCRTRHHRRSSGTLRLQRTPRANGAAAVSGRTSIRPDGPSNASRHATAP